MEANKILSADLLDILFEGKNKEYGAYDLRKSYNRRAAIALSSTAIAITIFLCSFISKHDNLKSPVVIDIQGPTTIPEEPQPILKQIKPNTTALKVKSIVSVSPVIVKDDLVKDMPVENKNFEEAKISSKTSEGPVDIGISAPAETIKNSNVIEAPSTPSNESDKIFYTVQIEAKFKGDWSSYVKKEIEKHIDELTEAGESGTCLVRFIVSKDGSVSDAEALTMKGSKLAEVAVNAIRKGPKWIPAFQNGQQVNAYRTQPVSLQLQDQ